VTVTTVLQQPQAGSKYDGAADHVGLAAADEDELFTGLTGQAPTDELLVAFADQEPFLLQDAVSSSSQSSGSADQLGLGQVAEEEVLLVLAPLTGQATELTTSSSQSSAGFEGLTGSAAVLLDGAGQ
jgi:hypothetical protein